MKLLVFYKTGNGIGCRWNNGRIGGLHWECNPETVPDKTVSEIVGFIRNLKARKVLDGNLEVKNGCTEGCVAFTNEQRHCLKKINHSDFLRITDGLAIYSPPVEVTISKHPKTIPLNGISSKPITVSASEMQRHADEAISAWERVF